MITFKLNKEQADKLAGDMGSCNFWMYFHYKGTAYRLTCADYNKVIRLSFNKGQMAVGAFETELRNVIDEDRGRFL